MILLGGADGEEELLGGGECGVDVEVDAEPSVGGVVPGGDLERAAVDAVVVSGGAAEDSSPLALAGDRHDVLTQLFRECLGHGLIASSEDESSRVRRQPNRGQSRRTYEAVISIRKTLIGTMTPAVAASK